MIRAILSFAIAGALAASSVSARTQPQTTQTQEQIRAQQQQQAQAQAAAEAQRKAEEAARKKAMEDIFGPGPPNLARTASRLFTETCLAQVMPSDSAIDLRSLPIEEWISAGEIEQIPWKFQIGKPQLRMDQRYELSYGGTIRGKDVPFAAEGWEVLYITGVSDLEGNWIVPPKSSRERFEVRPVADFSIHLGDCVFLKPGEYEVWVALHDPASNRHNVVKRRVRVPAFPSPELPLLTSRLREVEFPRIVTSSEEVLETQPASVFLPIANKQPLTLELIPILTPSDQWTNRQDLVRWTNNKVLAATNMLSQSQLEGGMSSIVVEALDLVNRSSAFRQSSYRSQNWRSLSAVFTRPFDGDSIDITALDAVKKRSEYFREWIRERLSQHGKTKRAIVFIAGALIFQHGSDLSQVRFDGDCNCRVYHLRFRIGKDDVFDHLERILKPIRPLTFDVPNPKEMRKALAAIVADIEKN